MDQPTPENSKHQHENIETLGEFVSWSLIMSNAFGISRHWKHSSVHGEISVFDNTLA